MSRFTVVWRPEARAELATIWMAASSRASVTAAADMIDAELVSELGNRCQEGLLRLEYAPLAVLFNVSEPDCITPKSNLSGISKHAGISIARGIFADHAPCDLPRRMANWWHDACRDPTLNSLARGVSS